MKVFAPLVAIAFMLLAVWYFSSTGQAFVSSHLELYGNVDVREISLAFDGSGRIAEMRAEEGDVVPKGRVIGVLDVDALKIQARQVAADVEAQRQNVVRLRDGPRPEEVVQLRAQLNSARVVSHRAAQDYLRAVKLVGVGSKKDLDYAKADADVAKAKAEELESALRLLIQGARKEEVAAQEAKLSAFRANLALVEYKIAQGMLRAPRDAVVRSRLAEPGDMVTPGVPIYSLAVTQPKWVRAYVSETDLGRIWPGLEAKVFTDSQPEMPISGRVGYISAVAEFTPKSVETTELRTRLVYEIRVIVDDRDDKLRLGQPVTLRLFGLPAGRVRGDG